MNVLSAIVNIGSSQTGRQFRTESLVSCSCGMDGDVMQLLASWSRKSKRVTEGAEGSDNKDTRNV